MGGPQDIHTTVQVCYNTFLTLLMLIELAV